MFLPLELHDSALQACITLIIFVQVDSCNLLQLKLNFPPIYIFKFLTYTEKAMSCIYTYVRSNISKCIPELKFSFRIMAKFLACSLLGSSRNTHIHEIKFKAFKLY